MDPVMRDPSLPPPPPLPPPSQVAPVAPPPPVGVVATLAPPYAEPSAPADLQPLRWGPIWAGLLTAIGVFFLLTLIAVTVGLQATPGMEPTEDESGFVAVIATSAIGLIAFFVGGFVASWSGGLADQGRSLLNGFLVWALWLVVVIALALLGLGSLVGAAGEVFGQVAIDPAIDAPAVDPDELISLVRDGAWQTLLILLLTAASASLGGVVGARRELHTAWSRMVVVRPRV
jgi:hypothetical protein